MWQILNSFNSFQNYFQSKHPNTNFVFRQFLCWIASVMRPLGKINIRSQSSRANESATNANYRGAGLAEMAYSIENKKVNKCNGELSLHVLDIIQSTMKACKTGIVQSIKTTSKKPQAFTLKEIKKIILKASFRNQKVTLKSPWSVLLTRLKQETDITVPLLPMTA